MLKLYNTITKTAETIEAKDHLNLYTCGPTVYNYAHIGNMRAYIVADLLYRTLKFDGYKPNWVMNITDIDDKTIKGTIEKYGAAATVENLREFTGFYLEEFYKDLERVNVSRNEITFIRVTDVMLQIQEFIVKLIDKGYAYKEDDGVYFNIEKYQGDFGDYGELVGKKFLEGKKVGARVKVDEYEKENLSDFALWKAHNEETDAQIFWDHPQLGKGRPGWHIECSVINNVAFNGEPTDIHTGGVDLIFPHHTNEIAQSQALLGKGNFVKHWLHSEHLLVDGKKMAKSLNNFYTLKDLEQKGFDGQDLRYLMLSASYRSQQNFTFEDLLASRTAREKLLTLWSKDNQPAGTFIAALQDNLNLPQALAAVWSDGKPNGDVLAVLGLSSAESLKIPDNIQTLLTERDKAKMQKDFALSDNLRKQIEALGYEVMDTGQGQKVKKKISI